MTDFKKSLERIDSLGSIEVSVRGVVITHVTL